MKNRNSAFIEQLNFTVSGLENNRKFPIEYTGRGDDISPEFLIENLSPDAKTIAIILEDLSHFIKEFTHWCIWNIPPTQKINSCIPKGKIVNELGGAVQGIAYGLHRYAGPKPPKGKTHIYRFTVYALDCKIELSPSKGKKSFLKTAENHILQKGSLIGQFE